MKRKPGTETRGLLYSGLLLYSPLLIPFWPHSLVFLPLFFLYLNIFRLPFLRELFLFSLIFLFAEGGNYLSLRGFSASSFSNSLVSLRGFLQSKLGEIVSRRYPGETGNFVNYLLFNKKSEEIYPILGEFNSLSITHLLVVSGMHMNLVKKIVQKVLTPIRRSSLRSTLSLIVLATYSGATGFSCPSSRVFFEEAGTLGRRKSSPLVKWSRSVGLSFLLFPQSVKSLAFVLSYSLSLLFRLIDRLELLRCKNLLLKISLASIFSIFALSYRTKKIFPFAVLNQLFLSPIVIAVFLFFLFSGPFPFLSSLGLSIYSLCKSFVGKLTFNKLYLAREQGSPLELIYFGAALILSILLISGLHSNQEKKLPQQESSSIITSLPRPIFRTLCFHSNNT